jgi:PAS domain S-box-containing protein
MYQSNKQESQYARSLIEASLDPLVTISPEGKITDMNEATVNITGIDREHSSAPIFLITSPNSKWHGKSIRRYLPKVR